MRKLTSFLAVVMGITTSSLGSLGVDPAHALIDNIEMSEIPGSVVIVR